jgi:tRNA U38,U39,U40 pseudouridine synthase TruA
MRPFSVLDAEQMENILYDIHLADATMSVKHVSAYTEIRRSHYDYIFEKHHITREKFEKSIAWYAHNPKKLEQIYDKVKERFNKLQVDVDNYLYHPENKMLDEIKSLDTVNLYTFEKEYFFKNQPPKDSLFFEIKNREYFALKDKFIWKFLLKIEPLDTNAKTLEHTKNYLTVTYTNGKEKTVRGIINNDNKLHRYTFQLPENDSLMPVSIRGHFFDGNDMIRSLTIDSAQLIRIYNAEKYPLPDSLKIKFGKIIPQDTVKKNEIKEVLIKSDLRHFRNDKFIERQTLQRKE